MSDPKPLHIEKGTYRHNKTGHLYEVLGVALHTENDEQVVVYRQKEENLAKKYQYEFFVRPYDMFVEQVEINGIVKPRFEKIND